MHKAPRLALTTIMVMTGSHAFAQVTPAPDAAAPAPAAVESEAPPLEGANSFTMDQARQRLEKAGYSQVTALTKDERGIWRAAGTKDGKTVNLALDYKGNIVHAE